jgi:hypothetical protein
MLLVFTFACGPAPRGNSGDDGDGGDGGNTGDARGDCADGTELIYTIDQHNYRLSRFDPSTKTFFDLGSLSCPASFGGTPFSMSVSRDGFAYVLYNNGELFKVPLGNITSCTKTSWAAQSGLRVFGMGFSTDEAGGSSETLYVGGGMTQMQSSYTLAKLNLATMTATSIGMQTQLPEMTGTGNAELWGFMPDATNARVVKFDKTNGAALTTFMLPSLAGTMTGYAFAHWGGDYWVFLIKNSEASTTIYQVDGTTGTIEGTTPTSGRTIVGAGVSTCAPVVIY